LLADDNVSVNHFVL